MNDDTDTDETARLLAVCAPFNASRYYQLLGMVAASGARGRSHVALPFREELTQLYGGVHGGALLSLADAAVSVAVATTFEANERTATIDISLSFTAPVGKNDVIAEAIVTQRGRRVCFADCVLRLGDGVTVVARGKGVCYVSSVPNA